MENQNSEDLKPEMSEKIDLVFTALAVAQGAIGGAPKDRTNPHFGSAYATLASVIEVAKHPLCDNGLAIVQMTGIVQNKLVLFTMVTHKSGQWIRFAYPLNPVKNDPQGQGSALTYARRYSYMSAVGVAPVDDDGEDAMGRNGDQGGQQGQQRQAQNKGQGQGQQKGGQRTQSQQDTAPQGGQQGQQRQAQGASTNNGEAASVPLLSLAEFKKEVDKGIQLNDATPLVGKMFDNSPPQASAAAGYLLEKKIAAAATEAQLTTVSNKQKMMIEKGWLTEPQISHFNDMGSKRYHQITAKAS